MLLSTTSSNIKLEVFFKPFSIYTWYLSAVFIVLFICVMRIIIRREETREAEETRIEKYSNAVILTIGITAQQGINEYKQT